MSVERIIVETNDETAPGSPCLPSPSPPLSRSWRGRTATGWDS